MPKISVVMPVYNTKEEFLRESIESILNQTYTDFEFIIINDGSTNNCEDIILSYKDDRIRYVKQHNQGVANTLNNGISIATGEYIARMDSDDISLPQRFEKQINFLDNNSDFSLCGSWYQYFPEEKIAKLIEEPKLLDFYKLNCLGHPTVMFRKADFERFDLKYDSQFVCEDYELWSRSIKYLKFYNLQEVLLKYRWTGQNISAKAGIFVKSEKSIRLNILKFLTCDDELQNEISNILLPTVKDKTTLIEKIFSIKNSANRIYKIITILGIKIKLKRKHL